MIKVTIHKLGPIKEARIDLKPLTVFVGPNNAGKTWAAYAISGILGEYGWGEYSLAYANTKKSREYPELEEAIEQVLATGSSKLDMIKFATKYGDTYINNVARRLRKQMQKFMDTSRASFEGLLLRVALEDKEEFLEKVLDYAIEVSFPQGRNVPLFPEQTIDDPLLHIVKDPENEIIYFNTSGPVEDELAPRVIRNFFASNVFVILHQSLFPDTYILPAERTTFITFPWARSPGLNQEMRAIRNRYQRDLTLRLPVPVTGFMNTIARIHRTDISDRRENAEDIPEIANYIQLAGFLEAHILGGHVDLSTPEPNRRREVTFKPGENITLEMSIASSMVKELSPLALYLRYEVGPGELLIIDEPEMNLHPEAQVTMMEFLAMLVNAGLNVLFTTHSSYMVDHLVNLMKAAEIENKDEIRGMFFLKREEAFISKDKVSVYMFEKGKVSSIMRKDGTIDWGTFSKVSDRLSEIYFEL